MVRREPAPTWLDEEFLTPDFFADPYPLYRRLVREAPMAWSQKAQAWLASGFHEVSAGLSDSRLSSGQRISTLAKTLSPKARHHNSQALDLIAQMMAFRDPPDHTRLRRIVSRVFTARRIGHLDSAIQGRVDDLIAHLPRDRSFDLVEALSFPLPAAVICGLLGIPDDRIPDIRRWSDAVVDLLSSAVMTDHSADAAQAALTEADDYIQALIRDRVRSPRDDLLTALARANDDGEMLSGSEITSMVVLLFFAGFETTEGLIGNATIQLMNHEALRQHIAADPSLAAPFVEETLRFDTSVHRQSRVARENMSIAGVDVPAGDAVLFMIGAAGRDPQRFDEPDTFMPTREDAGNIGFGHGIHFCLGAPLARLETRIVLASLARLDPPLRPAGPPTYGSLLAVRKPTTLPVTMTERSPERTRT